MDDMQVCLFNIQKFSIHDGPGIRTTVFFKGCPLACKWCSNPESQAMGGQPEREESLSGKLYSLKQVLDICLEDKAFYLESGGGVTLSGGEVLAQPKAAKRLLLLLKEHAIHTAIETSGYAEPSVFKDVIAPVDLLLYDLKHYDDEKHKQGTGVPNTLILGNLSYAWSIGKDIEIRIPLIPGYNATVTDAEGFAACIKNIGPMPVKLLPFHQFGQKKYETLGLPYEFNTYKSLHPEDIIDFQSALQEQGILCSF